MRNLGLIILFVGACGAEDFPRSDLMGGKADSNDFVTEISGIPLYGQSDARWGGHRLFNKRSCRTLALAGCTITALAMLNSYYSEETWTPKRLNDCIAKKGGHSGCNLDMSTSSACLEPGMKHHYQIWKNLYAEMRIQLLMGYPLLARVSRTQSCGEYNQGDHTVLVTGWEGAGKRRADFQIYDPKGSNGAVGKLSAYPKLCYLQYVTGPLPIVPML